MEGYPFSPQEPPWPAPRPNTPRQASSRKPRWALIGGLGLAFALILGLGILIGSTVLPALGAAAAGAHNAGRFDQFGQAGMMAPDHGPGRGKVLTVSSVNGSTITAKTPGGTSVTITTTSSTTYSRAGATVTSAAITSGTNIHVQGTRNSDGSIAASHIDIVLPSYHGTVSAVSGSDITIKDPRSTSTHVIHTDSNTTFTRGGASSSLSAVAVGDNLGAEGTLNSDGSLLAAAVHIMLPRAGGKITQIASDKSSVTVQNPRDATKTVTIQLSASTTYTSVAKGTNGPTVTNASVNDLAVGGYIEAEGTKNSDGSLAAVTVRILPGAPAGPHGGPHGRHGSPPPTPTTGA